MRKVGRSLESDERGMVSMFVSLIMILVITLIVLGFAHIARHNQREALDKQLSSQAFYAAESGVNDVKTVINAAVQAGNPLASQTSCTGPTYIPQALSPTDPNIGYSCLLVDTTPLSLTYQGVTTSTSVVAPISTATNLKSLSFTWQAQTGAPAAPCTVHPYQYLPQAVVWNCPFPILRVDLVRDTGVPITSADQLADMTTSLYLTPYGAHDAKLINLAGPLPFGGGSPTHYYGSGCDTLPGDVCGGALACTTNCTVTIPLAGSTKYYARMTSFYRNPALVTITGTVATGPAKFLDSQATVDVTGKSQDVLRRIQVRLGITPGSGPNDIPLNALTSTSSICKNFVIVPGDTSATICN